MKAERIRLFIKPFCGWCHEAIEWLDARGIKYEVLDVISNSAARREMQQLSGQTLAPTIDVDGEILADFGVDELEEFWQRLEAAGKMMIADNLPALARPRIPEWLRLKLPTANTFAQTRNLLGDLRLHTVCESAKCPNHWECWSKGTATFMIGGDRCTRACKFCAVTTAKPFALEADEPERVAEATRRMNLRHVVITAVARDDLPDGGADHFRRTIDAVRARNPGIVVEVLVPDFNDDDLAIETVLQGEPEIFNHNLETVRRLTPQVRSRATYARSLSVLRKAKERRPMMHSKSGLMLGLGETESELLAAMEDLRHARCDILTLGQYLQPTLKHLPVVEFIAPRKFEEYGQRARELGFAHVASGPMVRSSYHADEGYRAASTI